MAFNFCVIKLTSASLFAIWSYYLVFIELIIYGFLDFAANNPYQN